MAFFENDEITDSFFRRKVLPVIPVEEKKRPGFRSASELTRPRTAAVAKVVPTFLGSGCYVVSVSDPYGR
jgi:hypothetical protein